MGFLRPHTTRCPGTVAPRGIRSSLRSGCVFIERASNNFSQRGEPQKRSSVRLGLEAVMGHHTGGFRRADGGLRAATYLNTAL
jgi:hypothetical protein